MFITNNGGSWKKDWLNKIKKVYAIVLAIYLSICLSVCLSVYLYHISQAHIYDCININMNFNLFHTVNIIISVQQIMESFSRNMIGIRIIQFLTFCQFHNTIEPPYHKIMPNVSGMISDFRDWKDRLVNLLRFAMVNDFSDLHCSRILSSCH